MATTKEIVWTTAKSTVNVNRIRSLIKIGKYLFGYVIIHKRECCCCDTKKYVELMIAKVVPYTSTGIPAPKWDTIKKINL